MAATIYLPFYYYKNEYCIKPNLLEESSFLKKKILDLEKENKILEAADIGTSYKMENISRYSDIGLWMCLKPIFKTYQSSEIFNYLIDFDQTLLNTQNEKIDQILIKTKSGLTNIIHGLLKEDSVYYTANPKNHIIMIQEMEYFIQKLRILSQDSKMNDMIINRNKNIFYFQNEMSSLERIFDLKDKNLPFSFDKRFIKYKF